MTVDQALLDELWDFADPAGSEARFREAGDDPELRTQLARALGLQGRFDEAEKVLAEIRDDTPATRVRILLERGRLLNSSGEPERAIPSFEDAAARAAVAGLDFLELDAVHMLAIVDQANAEAQFERGVRLAESTVDPRSKRWLVSLHNNFGWTQFDAGRVDRALAHFEAALAAADAVGTDDQRFYSRWAIARSCRELGQRDRALALQEQLFAERPDDTDVVDELRHLTEA